MGDRILTPEEKKLLAAQLEIPGLLQQVEELLLSQEKTYEIYGITCAVIKSQGGLWFQYRGVNEYTKEGARLFQAVQAFTEIPFHRLFEKPTTAPDEKKGDSETVLLHHLFAQPLFAEAVDSMKSAGLAPCVKVVERQVESSV